MTIYCIGNVLLENDSLPLELMDTLRKKFPELDFQEADPNENFYPEDGSVILDTVVGIDEVTVFTTPNDFLSAPRVSAHDYDLSFHLKFLEKVGQLRSVRIIGIPQGMDKTHALSAVSETLKGLG